MPSWNDGESSAESWIGDYHEADYAPDSVPDPDFCGIDADATVVCRIHGAAPERRVAFEGTNTRRRFYGCSVHHDVINCGFVSWIDEEWPDTLKRTLGRLWDMYEGIKSVRYAERFAENHRHAKELHDLALEKKKVDEKYTALVADVNKYMDTTVRKVQQENYRRIMHGTEEESEKEKLEKENEMLKKEILLLKETQKADHEVLKKENEKLKEEKKKLEYNLYDLLKASEVNKEKIKKIRAICEE